HFRISVRSEPLSDKIPPGSHIPGADTFCFHSSGGATASRLTSLFPRKPPILEPLHQALVGFPSIRVRLSDNLLSLAITVGGRRDHRMVVVHIHIALRQLRKSQEPGSDQLVCE